MVKRGENPETYDKRPTEMEKGTGAVGASVDLGTTTVAVRLWDLETEGLLGEWATENPQRKWGRDVISRIVYQGKSEKAAQRLQQVSVDCVNHCTEKLLTEQGRSQGDLQKMLIVGNSTMIHFLFGQSAAMLSMAPFRWNFVPPMDSLGADLGLKMAENGRLLTMPNISGHIGSDTTAAMLCAGFHRSKGNRLLLDLGTNGEVVLLAKDRLFACSTAVGPAFEAASVSCGMIAVEGAIDRVGWDENGIMQLHTIGQVYPRGLCGSGLLDCVATLLKRGDISRDGRLLGGDERGILLFPGARFGGKQLYLTQQDVRQLQIAKAAVYAGIELLLTCAGIRKEELEEICLAGAFGSALSVDSGQAIGLFPTISREKMRMLGNAAGEGASKALFSPSLRKEAASMVEAVQRIELADQPTFQKRYLNAMDLIEG